MHIFQDLPPDFNPSITWLDGHSPEHPYFDNAERIQSLGTLIKGHLLDCILEGCRIECRRDFLSALESNENRFAAIDLFLSSEQKVIRAINYGVHRWVQSKNIQVDHPTKLVPPNAISSITLHHIAVRPQDFDGDSTHMLEVTKAKWDLHDFAHHTMTALSPVLYGNKYFTHLIELPPRLTSLIRSPGMSTTQPKPRCSDGLIFSEFLTPLFSEEVDAVTRGEKRTLMLRWRIL